jgi:hypothetical protein
MLNLRLRTSQSIGSLARRATSLTALLIGAAIASA